MNKETIEALTFMKKDPNLVTKVAILCLCSFIPIFGWAPALGYSVMVFRNYIEGKEPANILPQWDDLGSYFFKGISLFAGMLMWIVALVFAGGLLAFFIGGIELITKSFTGGFINFFVAIISGAIINGLIFSVLGVVFSFYAQTLEVRTCFQISYVFQRLVGLGKDYIILCLTLGALIGFLNALSASFMSILFYLTFPAFSICWVMLAYGVAALTKREFKPVLTDPEDIHMDRAEIEAAHAETDALISGDEYGNDAPGPRKASSLAGRRQSTSLTWSTDSDEAE